MSLLVVLALDICVDVIANLQVTNKLFFLY